MAETKTIKGQAWISCEKNAAGSDIYSLVQDQIVIVPGVDSYSKVAVLINNIWTDLTSATGTYKTNGKGYFYWEYQMTDPENDDAEITIYHECPKPIDGIFSEPYDPEEVEGDYAKYWVGKLKTATENYEYRAAIQKKEIIFPETDYIDPSTGLPKHENEIRVRNTDVGDITNLLNLF